MTTPIIHPINEKKPEFPCWLWSAETTEERWEKFLAWDNEKSPAFWGWTHWSPDSPLPPEVTPEQGNGETPPSPRPDYILVEGQEVSVNILERTIAQLHAATGPSPDAMEAAKELHNLANDVLRRHADTGGQSVLIGSSHIPDWAAIIDRKFPREEDGAAARLWRAHYRKEFGHDWDKRNTKYQGL